VKPACPYITGADYGKLTEFIAGRRGMERDTEHLMQLEQNWNGQISSAITTLYLLM
jgi:hypothetical protein